MYLRTVSKGSCAVLAQRSPVEHYAGSVTHQRKHKQSAPSRYAGERTTGAPTPTRAGALLRRARKRSLRAYAGPLPRMWEERSTLTSAKGPAYAGPPAQEEVVKYE